MINEALRLNEPEICKPPASHIKPGRSAETPRHKGARGLKKVEIKPAPANKSG